MPKPNMHMNTDRIPRLTFTTARGTSAGPPGYRPLPLIRVELKALSVEAIIIKPSDETHKTYGIAGAFVER